MTLPDFPERPASAPPPAAVRPAPLKFEPTLVARLVTAHKTLRQRFADLVAPLEHDPAGHAPAVDECAAQFKALRHIETIWLYPVIAQAVVADPAASSQMAELRLVGLILARRVQRCFEELAQAIRAEVLVKDATDRLAGALERYAHHGERVVYPLYDLIGTDAPDTQAKPQVA
jgi:hypothetical protein